jgi:murein DD-endopeptidase MepM/ murein hydrolase activator NlpD
MSKRATFRMPTPSLRTRAAVIAVGIGGVTALGVGVAAAADNGSAPAVHTQSAAPVQAQVHEQGKAANLKVETLAKKAAVKKAVTWVKPVSHYKLTASFAQAGGLWSHKHSGQDFAAPIGTNVNAVHNGIVVKAGGNGAGDGPAYGNAIVIKHGNHLYSQYAHLSRIDVRVGE